MRVVLLTLALLGAVLVAGPRSEPVAARHDDNAHTGYLYLPGYEMNSRTSTGQSVPITPGYLAATWLAAYVHARDGWNTAMSATAGFNVYVEGTGGGSQYVTVNSGNDENQCGLQSGGGASHGCLLGAFDFTAPSGGIYMFDGNAQYPVTWDLDHRKSDVMHEMGHALYIAGEHYPGSYNCSSTMGHCNGARLTAVQSHDQDDFRSAFRMLDAPDAAYSQLTSSSNLRHFFEGGYFGGNGNTLHAEKLYWIDRATNGVTGSYQSYRSIARVVNNSDDTTPNYVTYGVPSVNNEWCFKVRGETGGIADLGLTWHWGPFSRAYCVARSGAGSGVFVASNRNDYASFRIWNYSGAQINNVAILLAGSTTRICDFASIANNSSSSACFWYAGSPSGYLDVWYNWTKNDTIDYDARQ